MWSGPHKLVFVAFLAGNAILWSQTRFGQVRTRSNLVPSHGKRHWEDTSPLVALQDEHCHPISIPVNEQCAHVRDICPDERTFLNIGYLDSYFCAKTPARPAVFTGYVLWLIFLFSTLGISASDFFCPNLATIAHLLGLDENVAGVTFLAFGNGSPDMFATFSALRANSGGLAIGELLGAAAFIVSCVVGSMCIIAPFKVHRIPFLRDVGFFTAAVILLLIVLWDGLLERWETVSLVVLYVIYVTTVVFGSWWGRRRANQERHEAMMRDEYRDEEPYTDAPSPLPSPNGNGLQIPSPRARAHSQPQPPRLGLQTNLPNRPRTRSPSPSSSPPSRLPSFSLLGALEFRRVVSSLQRDAASTSLSRFESPATPYLGGHYLHSTSRSRTPHRTPLRTPIALNDPQDPWDAALGVPLDNRSPPEVRRGISDDDDLPAISIHVPEIALDSPTSDAEAESQTLYKAATRKERALQVARYLGQIVFRTLRDFRKKTVLGKLAALLATPAVMALTLTLPVVITEHRDARAAEKEAGGAAAAEGRLVEFEEEGVERALIAEDEVEEEIHGAFDKWLMAAQCVLGPLFCARVLFAGMQYEVWLLLAALVAGFAASILVIIFAQDGRSQGAQLARCAMGFAVAIVWIMAIADEVVKVLQTFGFIFGLSDAIIGLTIFAVGNSLADLVANMSVAVFAPIMGFSACFGGPMLNILLGVGVSGTYIISQTGEPYPLHFSTSLVLTGTGLLALLVATLVFVPLNGYFLPRRWGVALIVAYLGLMAANVAVEIAHER